MTENMSRVLERIYRTEGGYAPHKTALALERAGLVSRQATSNPPLIRRNDFPHYWSTLTDAGRQLCQERFGPTA